MPRSWYEVRIRENGTKKSKFYRAPSPREAASRYKGSGFFMWAQKVSKEKHGGSGGGFGSFFTLGDKLLKELRDGGGLLEGLEVVEELDRETNKQRRYHGKQRKEATNQYQGDKGHRGG